MRLSYYNMILFQEVMILCEVNCEVKDPHLIIYAMIIMIGLEEYPILLASGQFQSGDYSLPMAEPEAFSIDGYDNLSTSGISIPRSPFLLSTFLYRINEITKLDKVCYNNSLLVSFLPLWAPSVNVCLLKTGPEACHFYGVGLVLNQIRDNKPYRKKCITFEHHYNEKARIVQSGGGFFLMFPSCVSPVWTTEGLPLNKTFDSSLERVSPPILLSFHIASLMVGGPLSGRCYYNYSRYLKSVNNGSKERL
jgi:hypothetical protein